MAILDVLWSRGPSTVRDVHEHLPARGGRSVGYTSVLKLLQIMVDKGWAERDTSQRRHVFAAAVQRDRVQRRLVSDLIQGAFSGSTGALVVRALADTPATAQERAEIRAMLDALEAEEGAR